MIDDINISHSSSTAEAYPDPGIIDYPSTENSNSDVFMRLNHLNSRSGGQITQIERLLRRIELP